MHGQFTLPLLKQQRMLQKLGRGCIHSVIPINNNTVLVLAAGGASLLNFKTRIAYWEIDCPTHCGAMSDNQKKSNWVYSVAFSPNGRWVADDIKEIAFSPDSQLIASASDDKTVKIWEVNSGQQVQQLADHEYQVEGVKFSPDGQFVVSISRDKIVRLWHVISGKEIYQFCGHLSYVKCVAFSPDGQQIASGGQDKMIAFWDLISGELVNLIQGHTNCINSLAFNYDGSLWVSGDNDGVVRIWQI